ncbi:MAG: hypothetical protein GX275_13715 [Clostridiales bacterium]|nr:hypothetical protein [Clostridiales bacterium]
MNEYENNSKKISFLRSIKVKVRGISFDTKIMIGIIILFLVVFTIVVLDDANTERNKVTVKSNLGNIDTIIYEK